MYINVCITIIISCLYILQCFHIFIYNCKSADGNINVPTFEPLFCLLFFGLCMKMTFEVCSIYIMVCFSDSMYKTCKKYQQMPTYCENMVKICQKWAFVVHIFTINIFLTPFRPKSWNKTIFAQNSSFLDDSIFANFANKWGSIEPIMGPMKEFRVKIYLKWCLLKHGIVTCCYNSRVQSWSI